MASFHLPLHLTSTILDTSDDTTLLLKRLSGIMLRLAGTIGWAYVVSPYGLYNIDSVISVGQVPIESSPRAKAMLTYNTTYLKALYRGYTDRTFTQYSEQPPWLGTQGPILRSEVGDMLEIMFVNRLSKNYASMHSMGLAYNKHNEGGDYPGGPADRNETIPLTAAVPPVDQGIAPGNCVVYKWLADDSSGPSVGPASVRQNSHAFASESDILQAHSYHSYVDLNVDTNSGLIGTSIVYASGQMKSTMASYREIPLLYMMYDESISFLSGENAKRFGKTENSSKYGGLDTTSLQSGNYSIWHPQLVNLYDSGHLTNAPSFRESPMYSMYYTNLTHENSQTQ